MIGKRALGLVSSAATAATRRPALAVMLLVGSAVPMGWLTTQLELRTDFKDLLPKDRRSVLELERVQKLVAAAGGPSLTVAIEGDDLPAMKRFADAVGRTLSAMGKDAFTQVDATVDKERAFFRRNRFLYADLPDLEAVRDALHRRVLREGGLDLGLDDDDKGDDLDALGKRFDKKAKAADRFPDGYYVGDGGKLLAVFATMAASFGDIDQSERLIARVQRELDALRPTSFHPSLRFLLTGEAITGVDEYKEFRGDLLVSSTLCISAVLLSIVLFYGRLRSLVVIGTALLVGVAWTFGLARLLIGYLNGSTAFLGSIVAGNGVNFGIILLARYFEERRRGLPPDRAMAVAVETTAPATLGVALAAGIAYGSLSITSFRGFNQFGVIGGTGMALCWIAQYLAIPPLSLLFDRHEWFARRSARPWRALYSAPFSALVRRVPRALVVVGVAGSLAGALLGVRFLADQPFEYYFGNLKNKERKAGKKATANMDSRVSAKIRTEGTDGMAVIAHKPEQVALAKAELLRRKEAVDKVCRDRPDPRKPGQGCSPIGDVATIDDLLPKDQEAKLGVLAEIRRLAARARGLLDERERQVVDENLPPEGLRPLQATDLPGKLLNPFRERDGTIGRVLYVSHAKWVSVWHGEHLIAFSEAVEDLPMPDGDHVYGSGRAVIFADMIRSITADGTGTVLASFAGVVLLVLVMFGASRHAVTVLVTLAGGAALLLGFLALRDLKLNFLNFVALPITIGVGVDYAINMVQRFSLEPDAPADAVVRTTGGAILLCSVTTTIGYGALLLAQNMALNSFGLVAMVGEGTCVTIALLVLPAARLLRQRRT